MNKGLSVQHNPIHSCNTLNKDKYMNYTGQVNFPSNCDLNKYYLITLIVNRFKI